MLDAIQHIDQQLFEFINADLSNGFFDRVMPILREKKNWIPLYVVVFVALVWQYKWKGVLIAAMAGLSVICVDFISSSLIKPWVQRPRPCHTPELFDTLNLLVNCGSGKSFTSSHAANHFALGGFLGLVFCKESKWYLAYGLGWAGLISFAQVYVGVHYPVDVTVGAILGLTLATLFYLPLRNRLRLKSN